MHHSPPATRSHTDKLDERLKEKVKCYRRYLQKISRLKTKILCALRDEGVSGGLRSASDPDKRSRCRQMWQVRWLPHPPNHWAMLRVP